jgi:hypothetical protein
MYNQWLSPSFGESDQMRLLSLDMDDQATWAASEDESPPVMPVSGGELERSVRCVSSI